MNIKTDGLRLQLIEKIRSDSREVNPQALYPIIQIWVNNELVMSHHDDEYKSGKFAIQCHNTGMKVEMRSLKYRPL